MGTRRCSQERHCKGREGGLGRRREKEEGLRDSCGEVDAERKTKRRGMREGDRREQTKNVLQEETGNCRPPGEESQRGNAGGGQTGAGQRPCSATGRMMTQRGGRGAAGLQRRRGSAREASAAKLRETGGRERSEGIKWMYMDIRKKDASE